MKFRLQWKDPDWGSRQFDTIARSLPEEEFEILLGTLADLGVGEYLVVEIDTEAKTATIIS